MTALLFFMKLNSKARHLSLLIRKIDFKFSYKLGYLTITVRKHIIGSSYCTLSSSGKEINFAD